MNKLTVEAIRVNCNLSRKEFATLLGIKLDRYNRIVTGKTPMLAEELINISKISKIPIDSILI